MVGSSLINPLFNNSLVGPLFPQGRKGHFIQAVFLRSTSLLFQCGVYGIYWVLRPSEISLERKSA